ncbi:MAG: hypothetical protein AB1560_05100 [Pseudomonadota bacterium]
MNGTLTTAVLGGLLLLFSLSTPLWARTDADEAQLDAVRKDIDKDWANAKQADRIQSLASQFNVTPETVQSLRARKQGWGETAIELSLAQQLTQTDANTYPTMAAALDKIATLRSQKMGWGKIANYFGFKLGPVVSTAQHVRNELRATAAPGTGKSVNPASVTKAERAVRPERVSRPERPARPERAARAH